MYTAGAAATKASARATSRRIDCVQSRLFTETWFRWVHSAAITHRAIVMSCDALRAPAPRLGFHGRHKVCRHILSAAPDPQVFLPAPTAF